MEKVLQILRERGWDTSQFFWTTEFDPRPQSHLRYNNDFYNLELPNGKNASFHMFLVDRNPEVTATEIEGLLK